VEEGEEEVYFLRRRRRRKFIFRGGESSWLEWQYKEQLLPGSSMNIVY
jgi:hypothetical protein